ncbi:hypothetical protein DKG74_06275 [Zavarzinia aquatilis]|uniref:Uncharacterized protein n=1 Tax=Zavarzinia aquatilis TaxID=2211142 RepID=A0A317EDS2_9PROT|nr:hypothetical protein DKG74_06275 [Zavarzinia aquatilis]
MRFTIMLQGLRIGFGRGLADPHKEAAVDVGLGWYGIEFYAPWPGCGQLFWWPPYWRKSWFTPAHHLSL